MSTATNTQARFTEVAACSCAEQTVKQLLALNTAPSGKQWVRQRDQRRALWVQLAETATQQMAALVEAPEARKRAPRAKPTPQQVASRTEEFLNRVNAAEAAKLDIQTTDVQQAAG